jgi:hypothetical protein
MRRYFALILMLFFFRALCGEELALYYTVSDSLRIGITGAPYISYSSDKGSSFGLSVIFFEKNESLHTKSGSDFRMRLDGEFSTNDERSFSIDSEIPLSNRTQKLTFRAEYKIAQSSFYGIGGATDNVVLSRFKREQYRFQGRWTGEIKSNIKAGLAWDFSGYRNFEHSDLPACDIAGFIGWYRAIGMGGVLIYDGRSPNNFPTDGMYYKSQLLLYDSIWFSNHDFATLSQEYKRYFPLRQHVIAYQLLSENTLGDRPYHYLAQQGNAYLMRGYTTGRFLDNNFLGGQVEYRSPIFFWRVSGVSFVACGMSYSSISDLGCEKINITGGFGLRFAVDKSERVNLRADIGFSKEGSQIYLKFGEAF